MGIAIRIEGVTAKVKGLHFSWYRDIDIKAIVGRILA